MSSSHYPPPSILFPPTTRQQQAAVLHSSLYFAPMDDFKRSNIPAFGDWDYAAGLPITQYFESARQAGLIRYSCGDQDLYGAAVGQTGFSDKPTTIAVVPRRKQQQQTKGSEKGGGGGYVKEQKKQASVYNYNDVNEKQPQQEPIKPKPKPVDEDLYRIPPEFLYDTTIPKKKKRFGFFSRCLMPCAV